MVKRIEVGRPPDREKLAIGLLLLATLLWSLAGVGLKTLFAQTTLTATAMGGYRALFAGLVLLPPALRSGGLRLERLRPGIWVTFAACSFCVMTWTFVASVGRTTSANAILLMYSAPLWVLLLAPWVTGDRAGRRDLVAAAIGMAGMATIVLGPALFGQLQPGSETAGMVLALVSGLTLGTLTLGLRQLKQADPVAVTSLNNLFTGVVLLATAAFHGSLEAKWPALLALAALGAFQIGTPYVLYCWCLRHLTPQRATIIMLTEPILNPIWVWLVIGEVPTWATFLGGAMIVGALVVMIRSQRPARDVPAGQPAPVLPGREEDVPTAA